MISRLKFWLFLVALTPDVVCPASYYVSPQGSDSNDGSRAHPWANPGRATRQLAAGDTLVLLPGKYVLRTFDADILKPPSGKEGQPTVIRGVPGHRPILAGRENLLTAIDLSGVQHVVLEDLEITHDPSASGEAVRFRDGLEALGLPASHLVLRRLYIHAVDEFGVNLQDVSDVIISNCRVEFCGFGAIGGPAGASGGWRYVTVRACTLSWSGHYYQGGDGSTRPYDRPDGLGTEPSEGPLLIEDTVVEHNLGDGLDSKVAHTTIRRCVVANNSCDGVKLWADSSSIRNTLIYGRGDGAPQPTPWAAIVIDQVEKPGSRFEITNVTVDDSLGHNYLIYVQYGNPTPLRVAFRNCIFSARGPQSTIYVHGATELQMNYCLFHFPRTAPLLVHGSKQFTCANLDSLGVGNLCGDPHFVRTGWGDTGDYHLLPDSPARDAGDPSPEWNDPDGTRNDLGAYGGPAALQTAVRWRRRSPPPPATFQLLAIGPNPTRGTLSVVVRLNRYSRLNISFYDVLGRQAAVRRGLKLRPGLQRVRFNLHHLPTGIYLCQVQMGNTVVTRKICVLR